MSNETTPAKKTPVAMSPTGITFQTTDDLMRAAVLISKSGFAPKGMTTEAVAASILFGAELGQGPMWSVRSIALINGRPSLYGDALLALVHKSGFLRDLKEERIGGDSIASDGFGWKLTASRSDTGVTMWRQFTVADAKAANLLNKPGPWKQYPERMLWNRARAFLFRDLFSDVLSGVHVAEESEDIDVTYSEATQETPKRIESIPPDFEVEPPQTELQTSESE